MRFTNKISLALIAIFVITGCIFISLVLFLWSNFNLKNSGMDHSKMGKGMPEMMKNMPGMQGDSTKRYSVDWEYSEPIKVGGVNLIRFRVFNAANGEPVGVFLKNYTKLMHLIVVDSSLTEYQHLHPEYRDGWFEIPVTLSKEGRYNFYLDFVPLGAVEQQIGLSLKTSGFDEEIKAEGSEDLTPKETQGYKIVIDFEEPLKAEALSRMEQKLVFEVTRGGQPVTTLKPYLGAFGHLVMINADTYEYYHVHPAQTQELKEDALGGPQVEFLPMAVSQDFKPGGYRIFGQFNPDGNLIMTPFTVKVE